MNFWKAFQAILQMAPLIIGLVKQVEAAMPGPGLGTKKLALVLDIVGTAAKAEPEISAAINSNDLASIATSIVNATVATLNAVGVFAKPATP